jgi:threonine/homoserine/homoserine lactone efflux protein
VPSWETLGLFALAAVVLVAVPGPNLLYIANRALADGRRAGLASVLGVETGTLVWVCAAALGLSALLASSAVAFDVVRYAGVAYLVYLGVRTLLAREEEGDHAPPPASLARAYREGLLVQLSNPKVAVFFLALLPQFVVAERGSAAVQILVLGLVLATVGVTISSLWALAAGSLGRRLRGSARLRRRQRRFTGGVYLALGVFAAVFSGGRTS